MKTFRMMLVFLVLISSLALAADNAGEEKIQSLLARMTLTEKIGQLTQYSSSTLLTGPAGKQVNMEDEIRKGRIGSLLNATGAEQTRHLQTIAVDETRLGIPLIFGLDVIHGYQTIFPIPLGEAASWDLAAIEQSARTAAIEASAAGVHWTFAPMVDIARDPRWGRITEGAGEDPYLGSLVAKARVKGFQGVHLDSRDTIMACAKHFAGYGAAQAGRDYYTVDMSIRTLNEIYLKPFKAAVDAGVGSFMNAFNELNGIPCTGNTYLLRDTLKGAWGFDGMVVSDWDSIGEMVTHGFANDRSQAAALALRAGCDMDMMTAAYMECLADELAKKQVTLGQIDEAVTRVLRAKLRLGLFDDPYRYCDAEREKSQLLNAQHQRSARDVARKSIVLLKNDGQLLPLAKDIKTLALIGPLADSQDDMLGSWSAKGESKDVVTLRQGIEQAVSKDTRILYARGCDVKGNDTKGFAEAVKVAEQADVVLAVLGESRDMAGEAKSRGELDLPGRQLELLQQLHATGKSVVLVLMNGRPLTLVWPSENIPAILETWFLGTQAGPAIADVLFGDANPSGKLPVTFPYALGQVPIFYNHKMSGRPPVAGQSYRSTYQDIPFEPLYPFGFGLSYTNFSYSPLRLSHTQFNNDDALKVSTTLTNTGSRNGTEIVQLYIRDVKASVTRPVKELKGFQKVSLEPGKAKEITFSLTATDLAFYNQTMKLTTEPGVFQIFVGSNSRDLKMAECELVK